MSFSWCRSSAGYRWTDRGGRTELTPLAGRDPNGGDCPHAYEWHVYQPGDQTPPLFRQFAALVRDGVMDQKAALEFAGRFGHMTLHVRLEDLPALGDLLRGRGKRRKRRLTVECPRPGLPPSGLADVAVLSGWPDWMALCGLPTGADQYRPALDGDKNQGIGLGETWDLWARNAREMAKLLTLYDGLAESADPGRDLATLEEYIGAELDGRVMVSFARAGDVRDGPTTGHLDIRPRDLIGFIWVQFARQVSGAEEFRRCPACGEYFSLTLDRLTANQRCGPKPKRAKYSHARYCSQLCQQALHYRLVTKPKRDEQKAAKAAGQKNSTGSRNNRVKKSAK